MYTNKNKLFNKTYLKLPEKWNQYEAIRSHQNLFDLHSFIRDKKKKKK